MPVAHVSGLKASSKSVKHLDSVPYLDLLHAAYGTGQIYEWLCSQDLGIVYFDVDGKRTGPHTPEEQTLLARSKDCLTTFFSDIADYSFDTHIVVATSHSDTKLSFRFYCDRVVATPAEIKKRLKHLNLTSKLGGVFDEAVYGTKQKLRAVGSIKTPDDARVLALDCAPDRRRDLLARTIIQQTPTSPVHLPDTTKRKATAPTVQPPPKRPGRGRDGVAPADPDSAEEDSIRDGFRAPTDRPRALRLLAENGFRSPTFVGLPRANSLTFRADNRGECPCCGQAHDKHNWFATLDRDDVLLAKSYSTRCRLKACRSTPAEPATDSQAIMEQRLQLIEKRQGQTELDVAVIRNTLLDFGPHIEASLQQRITPTSVVMRTKTSNSLSSFDFNCDEDQQDYLCEILVNPTCRLSCTSDVTIGPVVAGWVGNVTLNNIVNSEKADTAYLEVFRQHERRQLGVEWRCDGDFYHSTGLGWTRLNNEQFLEKRILELLQPVFYMLDQMASSGCLPADMDAAERKRIKHGLRRAFNHLQHNRGVKDIVKAARTVLHEEGFAEQMDRERHLLGTPDGALDLRTGLLVPRSAFPMTSMAVRPRWRGLTTPTPDVDAYFHMIFDGDAAMVDYMQALLGAAITGERLEVYICFVGAGANGKGVTVGWLRHVLGPYYKEADSYIFFGDKRHGSGPTPALAELDRKRLAVVDESNPTDELNLAIVKRVTGTDVISCRQMYRDPKEMPVTHTQILLTNNLPKFDVDDQALERRIVVVPFSLKFVKDADLDDGDPTQRRADPTLARFLEGESPSEQFLVWLVRGAVRFYAAGNKLPAKPLAVREAERGYYRENDLLGQIIDDACDVGEHHQVACSVFNELARARGLGRGIKNSLKKRGFPLRKVRLEGKIVDTYSGMRLKDQ